jgi:hypothetical protein
MAAVSNTDRPTRPPAPLAGFARALVLGLAAGALCRWIGTPLPWLIGPLFACAFAGSRGVRLVSLPASRNAGQWVIGTALGLYFTPDVLGYLARHSWAVALGLVWAIVLGLSFAWALRRFAGADPATAYFAGAIGGASEMALQGERHGARVDMIAAAHSMRIMLVVTVVPFAYQWLRLHGTDASQRAVTEVSAGGFAVLVALTCLAAGLLRWTRAPNPWLLGPLLTAVVLSASGHAPSAVPAWIVSLGQVLIGISLGTKFSPGFFRRAPRLLMVVIVSTLAAMAVSAVFGVVLGRAAGIAPATMVLATSPGGIAEMSLTAKLLELGVPVVTVFHVARVLMLVLVGGALYRALARRLGWPDEAKPVAAHVTEEAD